MMKKNTVLALKYQKIIGTLIMILFLSACTEIEKPLDHLPGQQLIGNIKEVPIDLEHSEVLWIGKKVILGGHQGLVKFTEGYLKISEENQLSDGYFLVDMSSIQVTDLEDNLPAREDLQNHLKSVDFFDIQSYPYARFLINGIDIIEEETQAYLLKGEFTLKNITKHLEIPVKYYIDEDKIYLESAIFTINRIDYGVTYHSKEDSSFDYNKMLDWAIQDDIHLSVKIVAEKP